MRNPWSRIVSLFEMLRHEQVIQWDTWLERLCGPKGVALEGMPLHLGMTQYVCDGSGRILVDYVARFESLERDFLHVLRTLGMPEAPLPRRLVNQYERDVHARYTPAQRDLVVKRYRDDFETFGYSLHP